MVKLISNPSIIHFHFESSISPNDDLFFVEHHMLKLVEGGVLKLVLQFASQGDSELKFWSAAMLLNMAMTSGMQHV